MTDRELMQEALDIILAAIKSGDWKVDGACDPDFVINALRARLAQPEPAECDGGQCGIGGHCKECPKTKPEPEPEKSQDKPCVEDDGCPTEKAVLQRFWREHQAQPEREWVGLTDEDRMICEQSERGNYFALCQAIEAKLKEKNT